MAICQHCNQDSVDGECGGEGCGICQERVLRRDIERLIDGKGYANAPKGDAHYAALVRDTIDTVNDLQNGDSEIDTRLLDACRLFLITGDVEAERAIRIFLSAYAGIDHAAGIDW